MKKNSILGLICFLIISGQVLLSQTLKTFQGAYENGTATYQYYENENFERLFQGSFKYKGTIPDGNNVKYNINITGQYNKDKKDGLWTYVLSTIGPKGTTETVTGNYTNGLMEGAWSLNTIVNGTKKSIKKSSVVFKNNKLVGELNYEFNALTNKEYAKISVRGNFNDSSEFNGAWLTSYTQGNIQYEETRKYRNGVLYLLLHRRLSDGKIFQKIDSTNFVEQFFQNYHPSANFADVGNQKYVLDNKTDKYTGDLEIPLTVIKYWSQASRNPYFNTLTSPNPAFIVEHGYQVSNSFHEKFITNWLNTKEGAKLQWQAEQDKKLNDEKYQQAIKKADTTFASKRYAEAISLYQQALSTRDELYPKDQIKKIQQIIDEEKRVKEQEQMAIDKVFKEIIAKAEKAFNEDKLAVALELYLSALEVKKDEYAQHQVDIIKKQFSEELQKKAIETQDKLWITVEAGDFKMGCLRSDINCLKSEEPVHNVYINAFKISKYEVTIGQYKSFCKIKGLKEPQGADSLPITNVKWSEAVDFAEWLGCRLPTEAEWEYAVRGGIKNKKTIYSGSNNIDAVAWFNENANNSLHPVGQKEPNILGIYDMTGNVWEWCSDIYGEYTENDEIDPKGSKTGTNHVKRGGSYSEKNYEVDLRITNRGSEPADFSSYNLGIRLVKK
jgi:formylglycine-generating enzyme required for sulfatase activity